MEIIEEIKVEDIETIKDSPIIPYISLSKFIRSKIASFKISNIYAIISP
jgi:hypothetical protein